MADVWNGGNHKTTDDKPCGMVLISEPADEVEKPFSVNDTLTFRFSSKRMERRSMYVAIKRMRSPRREPSSAIDGTTIYVPGRELFTPCWAFPKAHITIFRAVLGKTVIPLAGLSMSQ